MLPKYFNKFRKQPETKDLPRMIDGCKISYEFPPIYNNIVRAFRVNPKCYFTYGDTLYNPHKLPIPPEIIEHEKIHMRQQSYNDKDAALWWGRYLREPEFRIDQEAKAYGRQYKVFCELVKDGNKRNRLLVELSQILAGPLYGLVIMPAQACKLITKYSQAGIAILYSGYEKTLQ